MTDTSTTATSSLCSATCLAFLAAFCYGIAVLVLLGGSGIWVPLVAGKVVGVDGLTTFVMATLAPLAADLLLDSRSEKKYSILWLTFLILLFAIDGALAFAAILRESKSYEWQLGCLAVLLTLTTWMVVTLKSGRFHPIVSASTSGSFGGETASLNARI